MIYTSLNPTVNEVAPIRFNIPAVRVNAPTRMYRALRYRARVIFFYLHREWPARCVLTEPNHSGLLPVLRDAHARRKNSGNFQENPSQR